MDQHACLSGSRSRNHHQRSVPMLHHLSLFGVETDTVWQDGSRRSFDGNRAAKIEGLAAAIGIGQCKGKTPLGQELSALIRLKDADHSVFAVIAWLDMDLTASHSAQRLFDQRWTLPRQVL